MVLHRQNFEETRCHPRRLPPQPTRTFCHVPQGKLTTFHKTSISISKV